jgi:drug/metabolite transporter (DMT)-like permease
MESSMTPQDNVNPPTKDYVSWIAFGVMAVCMSLSFVFVTISLEGFTLAQSAGGRIVVGAVLLLVLAIFFGEGLPRKRWFWKWSAIIAITNFVLPFTLATYSQMYLPSNVVGVVFSLIPLTTIGLSVLFLGVRISRRKLIGVIIGFSGLVVVSEPDKWFGESGLTHALPMLASLAAVASLAYTAVLIRKMPSVHPFSLMAGSALVASLFGIIPILSIFDGDLPSARAWVGLLGVAVFSTTIALSIRFFLIRRRGPVFLAPNAYIGAILVNFFGFAILGESITLAMMIAFPLIFLGLLIAQDSSRHMKRV